MKSLLLSIKPQWVEKILNKEKTIEIRRRFPSDYIGWVYIYCTKALPLCLRNTDQKIIFTTEMPAIIKDDLTRLSHIQKFNGKVVARFWCDKVEEIKLNLVMRYSTDSMKEEEILKRSCLTVDEIDNYLWSNICCGKAIHITKLEIFDKPKEISEFMRVSCKGCPFENTQTCHNNTDGRYCKLTRAPESYQFIEI